MRRLRAEAWLWAREKPAHEDTVGGVRVRFYKHPDVDAVDQIELVDVEIYWRDGTISQVVLSGRVVYDEPVLTLKGCNVDAEIRCGSSFNCVYRGILDLLARLGVDEKTAMAVEVQVW